MHILFYSKRVKKKLNPHLRRLRRFEPMQSDYIIQVLTARDAIDITRYKRRVNDVGICRVAGIVFSLAFRLQNQYEYVHKLIVSSYKRRQ